MQGLLLLNKPAGKTSYGAVAAVKWLADEKRVGHTGTLDPMATGVLPVFIGRATALSSFLLDADKAYTASVKLGVITDTEDITGKVLEERKVNITPEQLDITLREFTGKQKQTPPMYSALKHDGVRLYKLAREGKTVDIPERDIEVYSVLLTAPLDKSGCFAVSVHVSKGTYIRSLVRDIGERLGCGATLTALCRTATSGFSVSQCVPLEELSRDNIGDYVLDEENAVMSLAPVEVTEKQAVRFTNGGQLDFERLKGVNLSEGELVRVRCEGRFFGIGMADSENNQLAVKCVINHL